MLQTYDKGLPSWERLRIALPSLAANFLPRAWYGLPLALLALPLLLAVPRLRPFVTVVGLQLAAYLASCSGQPADTALLIVTTLSRFELQLLPATVAAIAVAWLGTGTTGTPASTG